MKEYKDTLNLPATEFPMRGNLPAKEPEMLDRWNSNELYRVLLKKNEGKTPFVLHDGPPFSNGYIHMGHALNKVLKDFIVKSKAMSGHYTPYVPGLDNHGLPIERAIEKSKKDLNKDMSVPEFRKACEDFAEDFIQKQMSGFKRLGVIGDWDAPYRTMDKHFEAQEVKIFGAMFDKGFIYKGLKPVTWCPFCSTAVAEADIEYHDDPCTSVYVKFKIKDDNGKLSGFDLTNTYFVIWTTTIWTLPGNMAICLHPRESYALVKAENGETYIMAEALTEKTMKTGGIENYEILATFPGEFFENMQAQHPFLDKTSRLVYAEYVTMDSGTGCVHTAPGFGADDYITCKRYGIDIIVPVDDRGYQTADAGKYAGLYYAQSNEVILADMKESGALFASEEMSHEYPHCWRCKSPIIFRATPQWFCSVEAFKDEAVKACQSVTWLPAWGGERMAQMVRDRADWCISRQRQWGLPIPVFYCEDCGEVICDDATIAKVSEMFGAHGSNAWLDMEVADLMPEGYVCPKCGGKHFRRETNTLDGWFDSGSSHIAVLEQRPELHWPSDVYLEGGDQYRGWFQAALLTAVGAKGEGAPYHTVLTHGWVVDGEGRAMHKSHGNGVDPDDVVKKYGGDIARLWAASTDYHADVRCSDNIFRQQSETYRKIRNTARILLANLGDFNPDTDAVAYADLPDIDKWILARFNKLVKECREAYDGYEFHIAYHALNNFCTIDLSKLYVDITKDRVYTERADSAARRSAQTAMYTIISGMTRLLAPILSFTAEEIWQSMPHAAADKTESIFLNDMPAYDASLQSEGTNSWDDLFLLRDDVMKALELARAEKLIGKSLDAKVTVYTTDAAAYALLSSFAGDLATVFITSSAEVVNEAAPEGAVAGEDGRIAVVVAPADGCKCDRCWAYSAKGISSEEGFLCERCKNILEL
ncbi:MAG: isoleucine--tRNA ligase [Clostridia bacterium]|nr:isoleucine--tRNA ligase [Clostridia bacterium]